MCDYSLCGLPTRLAAEGEDLVVHRFRSGSVGLASPAELRPVERPPAPRKSFWEYIKSIFEDSPACTTPTAICIPPGAQLILKNIPQDLRRQWKIEEKESVVFLQLSANPNTYRDAVRFRNGREVLLQSLREGIPVQVLSLSSVDAEQENELAALFCRAVPGRSRFVDS